MTHGWATTGVSFCNVNVKVKGWGIPLRSRPGRSWACSYREPHPKRMNLFLLSENMEEQLLGPEKKDRRELGANTCLDFPSEWTTLSSLEMRGCLMRRWVFSNVNSSIKWKICVFWNSIPMVVHSMGTAKQNDMNPLVGVGGYLLWMEDHDGGQWGQVRLDHFITSKTVYYDP